METSTRLYVHVYVSVRGATTGPQLDSFVTDVLEGHLIKVTTPTTPLTATPTTPPTATPTPLTTTTMTTSTIYYTALTTT